MLAVAVVAATAAVVGQDAAQAPAGDGGYDAAMALRDIAHRQMERGERGTALATLARAADAFEAASADWDATRARREMAEMMMGDGLGGDVPAAVLEAIDKLVDAGEETGDDAILAQALVARARVRQAAGDPEAAATDLQAAAAAAERLGSGLLLGVAAIRLGEFRAAGVDAQELAALEQRAIALLSAPGSARGESAADVLRALAYGRIRAGDTTGATTAAVGAVRAALSTREPWWVAETIEHMGMMLREAAGDAVPAEFVAAMVPIAEAIDEPRTKAMAFGALARVAPDDSTVMDAFDSALLAGADELAPQESARLHLTSAEVQAARGDSAGAMEQRTAAQQALLSVPDATERVEIAAEMAERSVDRGQGGWVVDLLESIESSLPDAAAEARVMAAVAKARTRLMTAEMEQRQAMEAAEMAGTEPDDVGAILADARQAAQSDLESAHAALDASNAADLDPRVLIRLGELERDLGDALSSEATLGRALSAARAEPEEGPWLLREALWQQALTQHELSRDDAAADLVQEMLGLSGVEEDPWTLYRAASLLANAGRYEAALAAYDRAFARGEADWLAEELRFFRAWARLMAGDLEGARADLEALPATDELPGRIASALLARSEPEPLSGPEVAQAWISEWLLRGPMNTTGEAERVAALADAAVAGLRDLGADDVALAGWLLRGAEALNLAGEYDRAKEALQGVPDAFGDVGLVELQAAALRAQATAEAGLGNQAVADELRARAGGLGDTDDDG
jgi:tetratricopeptide (TPR) repeat protein